MIDIRDCNVRKQCTVTTTTKITANPDDLEVGDNLAIYGAGLVATLGVPPIPTITDDGQGSITVRYKVAYMTEDYSIGVASAEFSDANLTAHSFIDLDWGEDPTFDSNARWILIWAKVGTEDWGYVGACFTAPVGLGIFADLRVRFRHFEAEDGPLSTPWYIPDTPPTTGTRARLLTTVATINGTSDFTIDDAMAVSTGAVYVCFDATPQILSELADNEWEMPAGQFMLHQDLVLDEPSPRLEGQGFRIGNEKNPRVTDLHFENGCGLSMPTQNGRLQNVTISGRLEQCLPAQDIAAPRRENGYGSDDDPWMLGAGVFINSGYHRIEDVRITRFGGNGMVIMALAGGLGGNANHSRISTLRIDEVLGHGLFIDGGNANTNRLTLVDVANALGWGILDEGQFGNQYNIPHASSCGLGPFNVGGPGGSSPTVMVAPYQELGGGSSVARI